MNDAPKPPRFEVIQGGAVNPPQSTPTTPPPPQRSFSVPEILIMLEVAGIDASARAKFQAHAEEVAAIDLAAVMEDIDLINQEDPDTFDGIAAFTAWMAARVQVRPIRELDATDRAALEGALRAGRTRRGEPFSDAAIHKLLITFDRGT